MNVDFDNLNKYTTDELQNIFNDLRGSGNYRIGDVLNELRERRKNEKKAK